MTTTETGISVAKQCGCYASHHMIRPDFMTSFTTVVKQFQVLATWPFNMVVK